MGSYGSKIDNCLEEIEAKRGDARYGFGHYYGCLFTDIFPVNEVNMLLSRINSAVEEVTSQLKYKRITKLKNCLFWSIVMNFFIFIAFW